MLFFCSYHVNTPMSNILYEPSGISLSEDTPAANVFAILRGWESAPEPYDIALGRVDARSRSWFSRPEGIGAAPWRDVAALGYPETGLNTAAGNFNPDFPDR